MSLHYLLDGYNILKQMASFRDLPLEEGRRGFLRWIESSRPQGSANNKVTVVFDGKSEGAWPQLLMGPGPFNDAHGEIRVIFTQRGSADDKIKEMVEEDADRKNCVVVSDDKDVFLYARSLGTKVMKVAAFTSKAESLRVPRRGKYIPLSSQEAITQELARLWLKEKKE